jgi:hypothetical protein
MKKIFSTLTMALPRNFLHELYFGELPQLDMHGARTAEVSGRIDDFLDPFLISGGYVRIVGGAGQWKVMPAIERHLSYLRSKKRITDFWQEATASFIIHI